MPHYRRKQTRKFLIPELNLTPLIDVALTLLVIFMVTAPMVQNSIKVDLPEGKSKEVTEQQELVIAISKDQVFYFNSYPIERDGLVKIVQDNLKENPLASVFIRADASVPYGVVLQTVDALKFAGVKSVGMSMRPA